MSKGKEEKSDFMLKKVNIIYMVTLTIWVLSLILSHGIFEDGFYKDIERHYYISLIVWIMLVSIVNIAYSIKNKKLWLALVILINMYIYYVSYKNVGGQPGLSVELIVLPVIGLGLVLIITKYSGILSKIKD